MLYDRYVFPPAAPLGAFQIIPCMILKKYYHTIRHLSSKKSENFTITELKSISIFSKKSLDKFDPPVIYARTGAVIVDFPLVKYFLDFSKLMLDTPNAATILDSVVDRMLAKTSDTNQRFTI